MSVMGMGYCTPKDSTGTGKLGRQMKATKRQKFLQNLIQRILTKEALTKCYSKSV